MNSFSTHLAALLLATLPTSAWAQATPRESFDTLSACTRSGDASACREHITASSVALYDRFTGYGLMRCVPDDARYVSQESKGTHTLIRARSGDGTLRLYFVEEEDTWKLDVPYTLESGLGRDWEKQVNASEQVYLLMKKTMGAELNCEALKALFNRPPAKR